MVSFTRSFLGCLLLGAAVFGGTAQAQTFVQSEKSETLMQREMDAFLDPDITTIPIEGHSLYKEAQEGIKSNNGNCAKVYPISTNPILAKKIANVNQQRNKGLDDLSVAGELNLGWGLVNTVEDGKQYLFTQELEESVPNGSYSSYYRSVTYRIYNDDLEEIKSFKVASSDTTFSFSLASDVSAKVFNNDVDWEFMVHIHSFQNCGHIEGPESCRDTLVVVNENSEILNRFNWASGAIIDRVEGGYSTKYNLGIAEPYYTGINDEQVIKYYDPKKIGTEIDVLPDPKFEYRAPSKLLSYTSSMVFTLCDVEDEQYYIAARYEKPFVANGDQMNPEWEMNNKFIIEMYDPSSFELVKTIKLPLIGQQDHPVSMSEIGDFYEYMITKNVFNDDDKFEIVYGMSRYYTECDCEKVDYYLVNEDGEILKEMLKQAGGAIKLQDIPGQSGEYAVLMGASDAVTDIKMYKMPEMEEVFTFPAVHNGELLSMAFERVPVGDSYQYVFGLGRGESADNTIYGGIAYYDTDGKMTKRIRIDLGERAALFSPVINSSTLNPYTFVADEKQEYLFFANVYDENWETIQGEFGIANDSEVLYIWEDEEVDRMSGAGLFTDENLSYMKYLYVSYEPIDGSSFRSIFYDLPLKGITLEGEGTEINPYKISNPVELDMVRNYPDAYFELVSDIDMLGFTGVNGNGFNPISNFTGHFNGNNHVISNLVINANTSYAGLFAEIKEGAVVNNLQIEDVEWRNVTAHDMGAVAGYVSDAIIENCHVASDLNCSDNSMDGINIGGLVGYVVSNSSISNSSYTGNIKVDYATSIGGIAGKMTTASSVSNCVVKGFLLGEKSVGGIAGSIMTNAVVANCYTDVEVSGVSQIGGIIGSGNGVVEKNYSLGTVTGDIREGEKWIQHAGGIAGSFTSGMDGGSLNNNIVLDEKVEMPSKYARVAYTEIGNILSNNYALSSMLIGPDSENLATVDESDETTVGLDKIHGKSVTKEELNQAFYEALGWSFGTDSVSPWVMTDEYPRLWHEFVVRGVKLDVNELTLGKGEKYTLKPEIFPADATNKNVRYASSDMKVASVSATGEITARGTGEADITVTTEEGSYKAVCHVTVVIPVEQIVITQEEVKVGVNEYAELEAQVLPEDATNKKVVWMTENSGIAYMIENNVVGVTPGVTNVIAMTENGEVSDTCVVTVVAPVEDLYLEETMISLDKQNPTHQLVARLVPETADATLVWETEDAGIAEVDQNGLVTGHRKGEIIVTVSTDDHLFSAECLVEVTEDIDISVDMNAIEGTRVFAEEGSIVVLSEAEVTGVQVSDAAGTLVYADFATEGSRIVVPSAEWTSGAYIVKVLFGNGDSRVYKVVL